MCILCCTGCQAGGRKGGNIVISLSKQRLFGKDMKLVMCCICGEELLSNLGTGKREICGS